MPGSSEGLCRHLKEKRRGLTSRHRPSTPPTFYLGGGALESASISAFIASFKSLRPGPDGRECWPCTLQGSALTQQGLPQAGVSAGVTCPHCRRAAREEPDCPIPGPLRFLSAKPEHRADGGAGPQSSLVTVLLKSDSHAIKLTPESGF